MVAAIGAFAAVGGSLISANAAGNAADQQAQSAADSSAAQERAAQQMRQDLAPWTNQGTSANNLLGYYLGLNPGGATGGAAPAASSPALSYDQIRQELIGQYTTSKPGTAARLPSRYWSQADVENAGLSPQEIGDLNSGTGDYLYGQGSSSTVDEQRLEAAIQARLAQQTAAQQQAQQAQAAAAIDPKYGSLLQGYRNGAEFDSGPAFSFTGENLASDPGYKFGLDQGLQGIDRAQASRGNFLSGAAIKEATRYNEDYAGTKFNDAFNRASSTYGTNLNRRQNEWNTNQAAYNTNRNTIYSFLTGQSTIGQNSAARVGTNNQQVAANVGANTTAAGNANAAATVASGNALVNGINTAANNYNSLNSAAGWNQTLANSGGGYSGYTGYVGGKDPIGDMNTANGWTN